MIKQLFQNTIRRRNDLFHLVHLNQGDSKRDFNPTNYRTEAHYSHIVSSMQMEEPEGGQMFGFNIVLKKKVHAYVEVGV